jgi:hypothetical protein
MNFRPDVVLVRPWARSAVPVNALVEDSLGVGYLLAVLRRAGYTAAAVDAFTWGFDDNQLVQCIVEMQPKIVGIALHSFADFKHVVRITEEFARLLPTAYRILGGEHATFLAREILERHASVDAVVVGEGDATLPELVGRVIGGDRHPVILGAMTRAADGSLQDGGFRPAIEDLDQLPLPAKDLVEAAVRIGKPVALSILTGRGCTHKCTFCTANTFLRLGGGVVWRRRDPVAVVDEMEGLSHRYGSAQMVHPMIQFQDVIFLGTSPSAKTWAEQFVEELERRSIRIPYYIMSRAEAILANAPLLPRLACSGLSSVEIGIESGVDRILQAYSKMNSAARTEEAISLLREHLVCYDASGFIMFDPRITLSELRVNAHFLRRLGHATWDRYVTRLQIFPGTAIKRQLIEEGLYRDDGSLDNVYMYAFQDPRVAEVAEHAWMYDQIIQDLDGAIHGARAAVADGIRSGQDVSELQRMLDLSQDIYSEYFNALVDFAEQGHLKLRFEECIAHLLTQATLLVSQFKHMNSLRQAA